jgi:hypothetical protein
VTDRQAGLTFGFLTVLHDAAGYTGGYLVTNAWGRPLEFRLTTPVQPNRVQQILYGATLGDYIHADLIGKTLVDKTSVTPTLIVTDTLEVLTLRSLVNVPVIAVGTSDGAITIEHSRSSKPLSILAIHSADGAAIDALLNELDAAVDLAEPFARIHEAMSEARNSGLTRAA